MHLRLMKCRQIAIRCMAAYRKQLPCLRLALKVGHAPGLPVLQPKGPQADALSVWQHNDLRCTHS
jgi:hypothetical protein